MNRGFIYKSVSMKKLVFTFLFLVSAHFMKAQIGVGEWRDHLPFTFSELITQSPTKVYVASENGIFSYDKQSKNIEKLTKTNLLSDVGISAISYSEENQVLVVGYANGNLDLIYEQETFNLSDIKREMISGSKSINHILFKDELAYLSCGFGIVVINIDKREVKDTYYIGNLGGQVKVNQLALDGAMIYAATNEGIFLANFTNQNLADFSNWDLITEIPNYTTEVNTMYVKNGNFLINQVNDSFQDEIYIYSEGVWSSFNKEYDSVRKIRSTESSIFVLADQNVLRYNNDFIFQDSIGRAQVERMNPYDLVVGNNGFYYIADRGKGMVIYGNGNVEEVLPNAPYLSNAYSIDTDENRVLVAAGALTPNWSNFFLNGAIFSFENERWSSIFNYSANDYVSVKIDPYDNRHFYAGAWGKGVFEYRDKELEENYNGENSTLQTVIAGQNYYRVKGMDFDQDNNLWLTNSQVESPVSVKMAGKNGIEAWENFNFGEKISNMLVGDIIVTESNQKWVVLPLGGGLFVFDENGTIDNENDDLTRKFSIVDENGKIISNNVYSIAEDLDGNIWVGTDQGIVVYYFPENVFESSLFYAQRIILTIGDVTQYLLSSEIITSIEVDGANRKWLGTQSSGVYLVSKDGTEEINHFTAENSPLLSNKVYDIGINHETGEVFFATDKGLISYRGSATMGSDEFRDVYVYPNPVREDYDGDVTIRGLVSDVNVKITDISGNIVYETKAEGGQATWDGKNFSGQRVSTGVYLVFCSNDDGTKTHITKLLFIK